ncbi:hypothetical protein D3C87_243990 [compost metagenome]
MKFIMKTQNFKNGAFAIMVLVFTLFITGCSGDDNKEAVNDSEIVGVWTKMKEEKRVGLAEWQDVTEDCDLDDTEEYKSNGDWAMYMGTITCGSRDAMYGTWSFRANETKVMFTYDEYEGEYEKTVEELSENKMILSHNTGDVQDTQYRITYIKK